MERAALIGAIAPALLAVSSTSTAADALPAFPGAEGFGADTPGGRGGWIIKVTNLNPSGPGIPRFVIRQDRGVDRIPPVGDYAGPRRLLRLVPTYFDRRLPPHRPVGSLLARPNIVE